MNDVRVPARYYVRLQQLLAAKGHPVQGLAQRAGINEARLAYPEATLSVAEIDALVERITGLVGDASIACEFGRSLRISAHSVLGFAMLSSPSVDYAMRLASRFFPLILPSFQMRYHCNGGAAHIRFRPAVPMAPASLHFHLELLAISTYWELRELMSEDHFTGRLRLGYSMPRHRRFYDELSGLTVLYESAPGPEVHFDLRGPFARARPALADPWALASTEAQCAKAMDQIIRSRGGLVDWMEMMLEQAQPAAPNLRDFARMLAMSERTLVRRLRSEGRSFRQMALAARMKRSRTLLTSGHSVTETALEVGYNETGNFSRAYRGFFGRSPSDDRAASRRGHQ